MIIRDKFGDRKGQLVGWEREVEVQGLVLK